MNTLLDRRSGPNGLVLVGSGDADLYDRTSEYSAITKNELTSTRMQARITNRTFTARGRSRHLLRRGYALSSRRRCLALSRSAATSGWVVVHSATGRTVAATPYRSRGVTTPLLSASSTSRTRFWFWGRSSIRNFANSARRCVLTASTLRYSSPAICWLVAGVT